MCWLRASMIANSEEIWVSQAITLKGWTMCHKWASNWATKARIFSRLIPTPDNTSHPPSIFTSTIAIWKGLWPVLTDQSPLSCSTEPTNLSKKVITCASVSQVSLTDTALPQRNLTWLSDALRSGSGTMATTQEMRTPPFVPSPARKIKFSPPVMFGMPVARFRVTSPSSKLYNYSESLTTTKMAWSLGRTGPAISTSTITIKNSKNCKNISEVRNTP